jgi:hypothetical protein
MRTYHYRITFINGHSFDAYCGNETEAAIKASHWAIDQAYDAAIESIHREDKTQWVKVIGGCILILKSVQQ